MRTQPDLVNEGNMKRLIITIVIGTLIIAIVASVMGIQLWNWKMILLGAMYISLGEFLRDALWKGNMKHTGTKATKDELEHLKRMMSSPLMYLSGGIPMAGDPIQECHRMALAHGLPDIPGFYGITADGEFVET
jgi:hypothetical protein